MFIGFDPTYLWCVFIPTLIISVGVQVLFLAGMREWAAESFVLHK